MYVYDEDKYSTRINCTELLSPGNAPAAHTGVQVEVYFSRHKPLDTSPDVIGDRVKSELTEMGLLDRHWLDQGKVGHTISYAPWANVIFDHTTRPALDAIWNCLAQHGLQREQDDLHPLTDWTSKEQSAKGSLVMAGRFGQWKYFWTDDCVLRGLNISSTCHQ
jgi:hypothetical protein